MNVSKSNWWFLVKAEKLDSKEADDLIREFQDWVLERQVLTDEDYLAALGPCGK